MERLMGDTVTALLPVEGAGSFQDVDAWLSSVFCWGQGLSRSKIKANMTAEAISSKEDVMSLKTEDTVKAMKEPTGSEHLLSRRTPKWQRAHKNAKATSSWHL